MRDIEGNEVEVGDVIRVINITREYLDEFLAEDEIEYHLAMVGNDFEVNAIVWDGEGASISIEWETEQGLINFGGLYLDSQQCRLIRKG